MRRRIAAAALLVATSSACDQPPAETVVRAGPAPVRRPEPADPTYLDWSALTTTTSSVPASAARVRARRASRNAAPPSPASPVAGEGGGGATLRVTSTAYCLTGTMANGQRVFAGAVAMNGQPFGSRWRVVDTGAEYVVADRIGHGSQFDIAMPGDCAAAIRYGRRTVTIERVA